MEAKKCHEVLKTLIIWIELYPETKQNRGWGGGEESETLLFMGKQNISVQIEFSLWLSADLSLLYKMKDKRNV